MGRGKTTLLELIGVADAYTLSKTVVLHNVIHKLLLLCMENTADDIWTILWLLSWKQSSLDLWPMWICSRGEEEVCPAIEITVYSKSILTDGLHMPCTRGGKDNSCANLSEIKLRVLLHCTPEIRILLHMKLLWIIPDIVEVLLLTNGPGVHQIFKKELSREEDMIGFICVWMKSIGQKFPHANMVISWRL